jgi:hypothetical protein
MFKQLEEGDKCFDEACDGIYGYEIANCYCHLGNAPCSQCTGTPLTCSKCGETPPEPPEGPIEILRAMGISAFTTKSRSMPYPY